MNAGRSLVPFMLGFGSMFGAFSAYFLVDKLGPTAQIVALAALVATLVGALVSIPVGLILHGERRSTADLDYSNQPAQPPAFSAPQVVLLPQAPATPLAPPVYERSLGEGSGPSEFTNAKGDAWKVL